MSRKRSIEEMTPAEKDDAEGVEKKPEADSTK